MRRPSRLRCFVGLSVLLAILAVGSAGRAQSGFTRGEVDGDHRFMLNDAVEIFRYLFLADPDIGDCLDAADTNDDGMVAIDDGIYLLNFLFRGGAWLPEPFPFYGQDPTEDGLGCERAETCCGYVTVNGKQFLADVVIYLIDRSGTMFDSGEMAIAKREGRDSIRALDGDARFAVIFFDTNLYAFPVPVYHLTLATQSAKSAAVEFIDSMPGGSGSCPLKVFQEVVRLLRSTFVARPLIVYLGDGGGTCGGEEAAYLQMMVEEVTRQNQGLATIQCFGVMMGTSRPMQEGYLTQLAEANGGQYFRIDQ